MGNDEASPDGQGCKHGGTECAYAPHMGCLCGTFGSFVTAEVPWQSAALTVRLTQYDNGTVWAMTYGHAAMDEQDAKVLDFYADVVTEAQIAWTASAPADGVGARDHFYGVII